MKKDAALMGAILLCSTVLSFGAFTYFLNGRLLFAILLFALYFLGGLFVPSEKIGMRTHAAWIGISFGILGAVLFVLPSAFA